MAPVFFLYAISIAVAGDTTAKKRLARMGVFALGFLLPCMIQIRYNIILRGEFFPHPYYPWWREQTFFSFDYLFKNRPSMQATGPTYLSLLLGFNKEFSLTMTKHAELRLYPIGTVPLLLPLVFASQKFFEDRKAKFGFLLIWSVALSMLPYLFYMVSAPRFIFVVVPSIAFTGMYALSQMCKRFRHSHSIWVRSAKTVAVIFYCGFFLISPWTAFGAAVTRASRGPIDEGIVYMKMREMTPDNAVLLADLDRFLVDPLWIGSTEREWVPLLVSQDEWRGRGGFPPTGLKPHLKYETPGRVDNLTPYFNKDGSVNENVERRMLNYANEGRCLYFMNFESYLTNRQPTKRLLKESMRIVEKRWSFSSPPVSLQGPYKLYEIKMTP